MQRKNQFEDNKLRRIDLIV